MNHFVFMTWPEMQHVARNEPHPEDMPWARNYEFFILSNWLKANVGINNYDWDSIWVPSTETQYGGYWLYKFQFLKPSDAVLFKLRWGGR